MYRVQKKTFNNTFGESSHDNLLVQQLISYIYSTVDLSKFKYEIIQYDNELPKLLKQKYFVSANFAGYSCFLIFCKLKDKYHTFLVDRQTLRYNASKIDYSKIKIEFKDVALDPSIYNGTIFDGILVKNTKGNDTYIISDVYRFCGNDFLHMKLDKKLITLVEYLKKNYNHNNVLNNLTLTVNKIFTIDKFEHLTKKVIPAIKEFKTKGVSFYPEMSGTKLFYIFDNDKKNDVPIQNAIGYQNKQNYEIKDDMNKYKPTHQVVEKNKDLSKYKYVNNTDNDVFATLEMKATENIDVYKLFAVAKEEVNGKTLLKREKMGIAYVPGTERSILCRDLLSKEPGKSVLMYCKFNSSKGKWEPLNKDEKAKIPTFIGEIDKQLDLIEISDAEDD